MDLFTLNFIFPIYQVKYFCWFDMTSLRMIRLILSFARLLSPCRHVIPAVISCLLSQSREAGEARRGDKLKGGKLHSRAESEIFYFSVYLSLALKSGSRSFILVCIARREPRKRCLFILLKIKYSSIRIYKELRNALKPIRILHRLLLTICIGDEKSISMDQSQPDDAEIACVRILCVRQSVPRFEEWLLP